MEKKFQRIEKKYQKSAIIQFKLLASIGTTFSNWIRLLITHKFRIDWQYIPYAILITLVTVLTIPFALLEKLVFTIPIMRTHIKEPIFIMGHMRSGTTYLHYLMSKDDQFSWITTPDAIFPAYSIILDKIIKLIVKLFLPKKRPMDNMHLSEKTAQEEEFAMANLCLYSPYNGAYFPKKLHEFYFKYGFFQNIEKQEYDQWVKNYLYLLKKISFKAKGKQILTKSIVNPGRIPQLLTLFPDGKYIFIVRNPYRIILSSLKLFKRNLFENMSFHKISDEELQNTVLDIAEASFQYYLRDRSLIKKHNLVEIKFEEFVMDPVTHLKGAYQTLRLSGFEKTRPAMEGLVQMYENYQPDKYIIDKALQNKIYKRLKFVFDEFGYDADIDRSLL
ncbi:MAG: sulfotransferase [Spirochaetes bacterium]|nr:sulfotransferase [Spirochaetota bacterium]